MFRDVGKKFQVQLARQLGRQLIAELHQLGTHVPIEELHSRAEAVDREDLEIARPESQGRTKDYFSAGARFAL